jgi:hypothetical protein
LKKAGGSFAGGRSSNNRFFKLGRVVQQICGFFISIFSTFHLLAVTQRSYGVYLSLTFLRFGYYYLFYLSSTCNKTLHFVTVLNVKEIAGDKLMTSRSYVTEEQGRLNNYAIEPKMYVDQSQQFGFNKYAEKLNGRLAMIGFVSLLAFEAITGQGLITWLIHL